MTKTLALVPIVLLISFLACEAPERIRSDAELGLTPSQATGRRIYDRQCGMCHAAYSGREYKGPSLQSMFKKPYLRTGAPANNDRVRQIILYGHNKMPGFGRVLSDEQVERLMEYLHTL
ncbi:MAG TPA: cytochrome c [Terriglobales bacterium]|nr:cytochrome c [Terriglobales bacterium]